MATQLWQCTNYGACKTADDKVPLEIPPGAEAKCPECGLSLDAIGKPPTRVPRSLVVGGLALAVLGTVAYTWRSRSGVEEGPKPSDSTGTDTGQKTIVRVETLVVRPPTAGGSTSVSNAPRLTPPGPQAASPGPPITDQEGARSREEAKPATSTAPVSENPPPSSLPAPLATARTLAAGTMLPLTFAEPMCESGGFKLEGGQKLAVTLGGNVEGGAGSLRLASGDTVILRIDGRKLSPGGAQPQLFLVAEEVAVNGQRYPVSSSRAPLWVESVSENSVGRMVRGTAYGVLMGGLVGALVKKDVKGVVIGSALGGAAGAAITAGTARAWCIPQQTRVDVALTAPLTVTQ